MKSPLPIVVAAFALLLSLPIASRAEPPKIEEIIELLHQAKDSDMPVPLLEKAHKILQDFKPANGLKMTASGIGPKRQANLEVAAHENKHKAMEAIEAAIETAKSGGDAKSKIESAAAHVHQAGELKR